MTGRVGGPGKAYSPPSVLGLSPFDVTHNNTVRRAERRARRTITYMHACPALDHVFVRYVNERDWREARLFLENVAQKRALS